MFNGKMKAITFSYDDGTTQDKRLVEIFNKYGLKGTFNLNSGRFGVYGTLIREGVQVMHEKLSKEQALEVYKGHEVAVHSVNHPSLYDIPEDEALWEVEQDRKNLEKVFGYKMQGMAYPSCGPDMTKETDKRVVEIIREKTPLKYARATTSTHNFDLQQDLLVFNPTVHHTEDNLDKIFELGEEFLKLKTDTPKIFYIWGHTFEFDIADTWGKFEKFCKMMSNKEDIFYGTNKEVLLQK